LSVSSLTMKWCQLRTLTMDVIHKMQHLSVTSTHNTSDFKMEF
jgi:hypothetical protein